MVKASKLDANALRDLYCDLMEEVKVRIQLINNAIDRKLPMPEQIAIEFCYLQLRLICELIALGCLAAHGDVKDVRSKKLAKEFHAGRIISHLASLHPHFYPMPSKQLVDPITGRPSGTEPIKEPYLTKQDLIDLYGYCGDRLHRGSFRDIRSRTGTTADFEHIDRHVKKIIALLNHHQIQLIDPDKMFWVLMQASADGKVHGALMKRLGPAGTAAPVT